MARVEVIAGRVKVLVIRARMGLWDIDQIDFSVSAAVFRGLLGAVIAHSRKTGRVVRTLW
jgi:hypothetical protein